MIQGLCTLSKNYNNLWNMFVMLILCLNATGSLVETTISTNVCLHNNLEISCKEISINQSYREISSKFLISYRKTLTQVIEIFYNFSRFRRNLSRSLKFSKTLCYRDPVNSAYRNLFKVIEIFWFGKLSKTFSIESCRDLSKQKFSTSMIEELSRTCICKLSRFNLEQF